MRDTAVGSAVQGAKDAVTKAAGNGSNGGSKMSRYHCTQESPVIKPGDTCTAEPIAVKITHSGEQATEFGSYMTWQANPAPAEQESEPEGYS